MEGSLTHHSLTQLHSLTRSLTHSLTYFKEDDIKSPENRVKSSSKKLLKIGNGNYLLTDGLTDWLTDSLTHSLTHSLTYSLTYLLTHSFSSLMILPENCKNILSRLLQPQQNKRLSSTQEVYTHPWLRGYPWDELEQLKVEPEYIPDTKYIRSDLKSDEVKKAISDHLKSKELPTKQSHHFRNFYYNYNNNTTDHTTTANGNTKYTPQTQVALARSYVLSRIYTHSLFL